MALYKAFSTTLIGNSHTKHGKGCEDYSLCWQRDEYIRYGKEDRGRTIDSALAAVVADGHGADECFRSAKGAQIAATCARIGIAEYINRFNSRFTATLLHSLVKRIIDQWHNQVEQHIKAEPFTAAELEAADEKYRRRYAKGEGLHKAYGSTLIACAVTPKYWFGLHIGDGRLTALYADGKFDQPVPWDPKCFLNQTTSICDDDAAQRARVYVSFHAEKPPPAAVFLCSDGVDDNYPVEGNEQHLFKLYRTIALTFAEDGFDSTCEQLKGLANAFATKGKGDDTSIAGIIDMDAVKRAVRFWREQIAVEETEAAHKDAARENAAQGKTPLAAPEGPPEAAPAPRAEDAQAQAVRAYEKTMNRPEGNISAYGDFQSASPVKQGDTHER